MATISECEQALQTLASRLAGADPAARKKAAFDRSLSCTLRDLSVIFGAHLHDGELTDIRQVDEAQAQVRMAMSSDDLLKLVAGELSMPTALATGRIKIDASVLDLLKLRSIF
ncbi:MAG: alkyl sulfatase C-terminal domain-containing protein [Jatrophihabitantaceae bacterium]